MSISVVVPCFDSCRYLGETLRSLFEQTRRPDEVIVVDDGSADRRTLAVLGKLPEGVKLLRQANAGPGAARNLGVRAAKGDLILPLDSDDLLEPEALASYEKALHDDPDAWFAQSHLEWFGARSGAYALPRFNAY